MTTSSHSHAPETQAGASLPEPSAHEKPEDRLLSKLSDMLAPLGYELVHVEVQTNRQRILRLFIDRLDRSHDEQKGGVGIDDCALVSRTLDEPLESIPEVTEIFKGAPYELEVSSPGVDRPLRREDDYRRFAGRRIRLNTFRPLSAEELGHTDYASQNPRQKNFLGELLGLDAGKVLLKSSIGDTPITIPLSLVAKANLDPDFHFSGQESPTGPSGRQKKPKTSLS
ncbi:MAG: hypothetical protein RJB38_2221 [Pseudomonadota bacterium]